MQTELSAAIDRVLRSGWFVLGPEVSAFEAEFASYCGAKHCVSLANGTDALELALRALDIGEGKAVLTVANAGMYSTVAILAAGAKPVYAEVRPDTLLVDTADVARILEHEKIDAIIVTHLYGLLGDIRQVIELARARGIPVIEDCAQAHGAVRDGRKAGSFGDIACFSFYPTKNLGALGDGGAIVTSRDDLAGKVRQLRQYGWSGKYHAELPGGRNSRLDEMQAAVLRVMLPRLDQWNARRREIAARYSRGIEHPKVTVPAIHGDDYVAHLYVIRTPERDRLKQHLAGAGIPCDIHYPVPDYAQEACRHLFEGVDRPVTAQACGEVLTLPCFPEMADDEVDFIIARVNSW
ncbi:aminotransferase [Ferrigenium kumadai]|uniref:Aminotransferase n=1 Tax=Ferrigenium kumadai TaxID=1682490 RepID=A0AAN1T2C0_9PROT|nr:DegT/DnrJ/EryC1/StrS family aminotransferase [Ferrigenium kumadai]BBJ00620.1 aminotransferase [Ferrigenium kumadai]